MIERNKNTFHRASIKILAPVPVVLRNIAGSKSKAHFELLLTFYLKHLYDLVDKENRLGIKLEILNFKKNFQT